MDTVCSYSDVVIDVRDAAAFATGHLPHATHFDGLDGQDGLLARLSELPEPALRTRVTVVAGTSAAASAAAVELRRAGFQDVQESTDLAAPETGALSARLWRPSPLAMRAHELAFEYSKVRSALDVGSGGGRDSAWLAARGWRVVAVDRSDVLAERAARLAKRRYVGDDNDIAGEGNVRAVVRTFGTCRTNDATWLREHASSLVLVVRFLRRSVLPLLREAVLPGGIIAYEHFLEGSERFGAPRKPAQMLKRRELAALFCAETGFEIIVDEEAKLADGRPINQFMARRVAL